MQDDVTLIGGCRDVQESHLVGALLVIAAGNLDRVAGVSQVDEIGAFDDTSSGDIKAGDDSFG